MPATKDQLELFRGTIHLLHTLSKADQLSVPEHPTGDSQLKGNSESEADSEPKDDSDTPAPSISRRKLKQTSTLVEALAAVISAGQNDVAVVVKRSVTSTGIENVVSVSENIGHDRRRSDNEMGASVNGQNNLYTTTTESGPSVVLYEAPQDLAKFKTSEILFEESLGEHITNVIGFLELCQSLHPGAPVDPKISHWEASFGFGSYITYRSSKFLHRRFFSKKYSAPRLRTLELFRISDFRRLYLTGYEVDFLAVWVPWIINQATPGLLGISSTDQMRVIRYLDTLTLPPSPWVAVSPVILLSILRIAIRFYAHLLDRVVKSRSPSVEIVDHTYLVLDVLRSLAYAEATHQLFTNNEYLRDLCGAWDGGRDASSEVWEEAEYQAGSGDALVTEDEDGSGKERDAHGDEKEADGDEKEASGDEKGVGGDDENEDEDEDEDLALTGLIHPPSPDDESVQPFVRWLRLLVVPTHSCQMLLGERYQLKNLRISTATLPTPETGRTSWQTVVCSLTEDEQERVDILAALESYAITETGTETTASYVADLHCEAVLATCIRLNGKRSLPIPALHRTYPMIGVSKPPCAVCTKLLQLLNSKTSETPTTIAFHIRNSREYYVPCSIPSDLPFELHDQMQKHFGSILLKALKDLAGCEYGRTTSGSNTGVNANGWH